METLLPSFDRTDSAWNSAGDLTEIPRERIRIPGRDAEALDDGGRPVTEYTWRRNDYTASSKATTDRAQAADAARRCRAANPSAGLVAIVRRHATAWEVDQQP